ncbi:tripartite-type tricarboxylate transporter receptor subunit TctC [Roseinatronobacter thiooxidans]|uniref:Tripartite-type tricarboxylate transporter receptor subunit TctC n=1 Tax=Roseinatronobacter thiooxidans TaxID=121821 RepID=A0A2W7PT64_9RHOB|nr:tripartite tricarboxylate transporter substrate binding protein [Roseinatronobacter thiooxidans]PZX39514.1 tripartite-type tricarboxylate transporter receptor subunit TctC [Roseinatronobacter thiooxidans]
MTITLARRTVFGLAAAAALTTAMPASAADWQPNRPVEMVIMAGQGGGADRLARLFQSIIQQEGLARMPFMPVNKGGGSGAEALRYVKDNAANPHIIMATLNSYFTTPLQTDIGVDIEEFTPIARMAVDTFALWVNVDSGIETLDQYIEAVKAADGAWRMGGTGSGQEDSLVTALLEREFGIRHTYVPMGGGGEVATQLAGGHIDATVNNPSEAMSFWQAGRVRPIALLTGERLESMPDVQTFAELGYPLEYYMQRSFVAPAGITEAQQAYYIDLLEALSQTEAWQSYATEQALLTDFLSGDALQAYFLQERDLHRDLLASIEQPS